MKFIKRDSVILLKVGAKGSPRVGALMFGLIEVLR